jgi:pyrimidine-specific ribonucleoside hydrolase
VRKALEWFEVDIPVGAYNINTEKSSVSDWHYKAYGHIAASKLAQSATDVLINNSTIDTVVVTGAILRNLENTIIQATKEQKAFNPSQIVIQGGFAGEGLVPAEKQLEKFRGQRTAISHNLSKHPRSVFSVLNYPEFKIRRFVSKNVCHKVVYDKEMHDYIGKLKEKNLSLKLIWQGMEVFLQDYPIGKMLHDPLAACCAIEPSIGEWVAVDIYQEKGAWGALASPSSNNYIIVDYNHELFLSTFTA